MVKYALLAGILTGSGIYFSYGLQRAAEAFGFRMGKGMRGFLRMLAVLIVIPAMDLWGLWAVVVFYFLAFSLCADGLHWFWKRSRERAGAMPDRRVDWLWASGLLPVLALAAALLYGWWNMHHVIRTSYVVYTEKAIRKEGYRIAFLSDLHYGTTMDAEALARVCGQLQQEQPDLLVLGGDLVDEHTSREALREVFAALAQIRTRYGIYYIYGNHDRNAYADVPNYTEEELEQALASAHITILRDEMVEIENELLLVGRDDPTNPDATGRKSGAALIEGLNQKEYLVLLQHQPCGLQEHAALGFDLQLSGHTHGGQIFPVGWLYRLTGFGEWNYGRTTVGGLTVIVSSGIGGLNYPIRTGRHSEYVMVQLLPS